MGTIENVSGFFTNPEFLAEDTALKDLDDPDGVLIGGPQTPERNRRHASTRRHLRKLGSTRTYSHHNFWSSELSKFVANAFLAQRVSSINSVSRVYERTGADVREGVPEPLGPTLVLGPKLLTASIGFGGSCFEKDILKLVYICEQFWPSRSGAVLATGCGHERVPEEDLHHAHHPHQGHERPAPERVLQASQGVSPQYFGSHTIGAECPANLSPRALEFCRKASIRFCAQEWCSSRTFSQQNPYHAPGNMECYVYIRKALYANIWLSGAGTTCFKSSGTYDEGTDGISSARDRQGEVSPEALGASRAAEANSLSVFATKWRFSSENGDLSGYPYALV